MSKRFSPPHKWFGMLLALGLVAGPLSNGIALGFAPEDDILKIKGYSPELITTTEKQRSRQEWKQPTAPVMTPMERFFHNIYYNEWTGSVDEFGGQVIRTK